MTPFGDAKGEMVTYRIRPGQLHAALVDVAADGEALQRAAKDTASSGEETAGRFGTATEVESAFARFWSPRDDVGQRIASLVFRKATGVADAAQAVAEGDDEMAADAAGNLAAVPAGSLAAVPAGDAARAAGTVPAAHRFAFGRGPVAV